jgi:histidinol dehydrogenase
MRIVRANEFQAKRRIEPHQMEQQQIVSEIVDHVRIEGDAAVLRYTSKFDQIKLEASELRVGPEQFEAAYELVEPAFMESLRLAATQIRVYHEKQLRQSWFDLQENGTMLGQIIRPLSRVGVYVPGGKAAYPSSVLMNIIPAVVAGVKQIVMVTPPGTAGQQHIDPHILVAAAEAGVTEMYRVGGAQAIAALAYGTETIPAVDKIVGPGNIYVALAKRLVYGIVDIDSIAGPSEIVIIADTSANPAFIAADLLSQAEHDELASAICITTSLELAEQVQAEIKLQLATLPRRVVAEESIARHGAILVAESLDEAIRISNQLAPEHLELMIEQPLSWLSRIEHAGAIFIGDYSSEPVGDYFAGPNHVLPTNGTARFFSPLGVDTFMKRSSLIAYSREALMENGQHIMTLARKEGLEGHARAIEIRLREGQSSERGMNS